MLWSSSPTANTAAEPDGPPASSPILPEAAAGRGRPAGAVALEGRLGVLEEGGATPDLAQVREVLGCIWRHLSARPAAVLAEPPLYPEPVEEIYQRLLAHEVEPTLARSVADALLEGGADRGPGVLREEARGMLARLVGQARPAGGRRVVALVGPTGVGKTTTVAKLAGAAALARSPAAGVPAPVGPGGGARVGLVTIDTFRVGAAEQLRAYAAIVGIPCLVAATPEELAEAVEERLAACDLVLVDTAGRNHRDEVRMEELERFWRARRPDEIHLVVTAGTRYADALEIVDRYGRAGFDRLLFTKLDETERLGLLVNLPVAAQRPVSYLCAGQRVPEDLMPARPREIARLLV